MARYTIDNLQEPIDFEIGDDLIARTVQNAKNLLMTQMGEVPYDRLRGLNPALLHLPLEEMQAALLPELDRVMAWEPDAEIVEAAAEADATGKIVIRATIEVADGGEEA